MERSYFVLTSLKAASICRSSILMVFIISSRVTVRLDSVSSGKSAGLIPPHPILVLHLLNALASLLICENESKWRLLYIQKAC